MWTAGRRKNTFVTFAREYMARLGFTEVAHAPWMWRNHQGDFLTAGRLPAAIAGHGGRVQLCAEMHRDALRHELREQWRAQQWDRFRLGGTRAATRFREMPWRDVMGAFRATRRHLDGLPAELAGHAFAIVAGGYYSHLQAEKVFGRLRPADPAPPCHRCAANVPAERDHEWWACAGIPCRPQGRPRGALQRHLGWATGEPQRQATDGEVLIGLARTRRWTLEERYANAEQPHSA